MGDNSQNQTQIEKLIEIANQLEQRELALSREARHLEEMKASLEEQERRLAATAKPEAAHTPPQLAHTPARPAAPVPAAPKPAQQKTTVEAVREINEILQSIFWDYSSSVHQISSQLSTVTAAMMCAAVTCVLENRGFNAKEVFLQEMEKMLQGGGLGTVSARPLDRPVHPASAPAPAPKPAAAPGGGGGAPGGGWGRPGGGGA